MLRASALALTALALSACTIPDEGEKPAASASDKPSALASVSVESILNAPKVGIDDQFISCIQDRGNGVTESQFFLIYGGEVKSYSQMQNRARPMCDAGQPGCALGWQGDDVALYFETASGAVNQMLLDLEAMELRKRLSTASRGVEESTAQCTSGPLPDGVTID